VERTHNHVFAEEHQDTVAYTPEDIPAVPTARTTRDHYRGAGRSVLRGAGDPPGRGYRWVDPNGLASGRSAAW